MNAERKCEALAMKQWGLISRQQARTFGMTDTRIEHRLESKAWVSVMRGVYRMPGSFSSWHQSVMACCLWASKQAVASHETAAMLWKLDKVKQSKIVISTHARQEPPAGRNIEVHQSLGLKRSDVRACMGIPTTSVVRTFIDIAGRVSSSVLEEALDSALLLRKFQIEELVARMKQMSPKGRAGFKRLQELVAARTKDFAGDSVLELRLNKLLGKAGLPQGTNQFAITDERANLVARVDVAYPLYGIAIQADGYRWHGGRKRFSQDLNQRNQLMALGWRVLHVTWEELQKERPPFLATLKSWLQPEVQLSLGDNLREMPD